MEYGGLLLINKPKGWTSHDVVAKVRNMLRAEIRNEQLENNKKLKVGHTGTLDPLATGLMIVVVDSYCKRASEFNKLDKTYEITMKLGEASTTGDSEGEITKVSNAAPSSTDIKNAIVHYTTSYDQTPPIYSALKVGGKRAYKLAREGKEVVMEPRRVSVYQTELISYDYPLVNFTAKVSSGTYIRSLVEDIGKKLDTGAYMADLRRTEVGDFNLQEASRITEVKIDKIINI